MKALTQYRPNSDAASRSDSISAPHLSLHSACSSSASSLVTRVEVALSATSPSVRFASLSLVFTSSTPTADFCGTFHYRSGLAKARSFSSLCCIACLSFYRSISTFARFVRGYLAFRHLFSSVTQSSHCVLSPVSGLACNPKSPNETLPERAGCATRCARY